MKKQIFDFETWRKRILEIKDQNTHTESLEFWSLVDLVESFDDVGNDLNIARTLFQTFTNKPDHGVKESVVRILGLFDIAAYYRAYLEELPYLTKETQKTGWYFVLADYPERELNNEDADVIVSIVKEMPLKTQQMFEDIISKEDFIEDCDWAQYVLRKLKYTKSIPKGDGLP
jgi:hypothetical protein